MDPVKFRKYPAKILLFGEYLVFSGGKALSVPYTATGLVKSFKQQNTNQPFYFDIYNYLLTLPIFEGRVSSKFRKEIYSGLHYNSTIPVGYGMGSSGAMVANIYDDYIKDKKTNLKELQNELAAIEGFFHEKSSGIDPLTSYIQRPVVVDSNSVATDFKLKNLNRFYIYDSKIKRSAKQAISHFQKLNEDVEFQQGLKSLTMLNNILVDKSIAGEDITEDMKNFSILQMNLFWDFIPESVQRIWERGINLDTYYMKLCGAGMGGMFLIYTDTRLDIPAKPIITPPKIQKPHQKK